MEKTGNSGAFVLVCAFCVAATCFTFCTPRLADLAVAGITPAEHDSAFFPSGHGGGENPGGDCNACHGGGESFSDFNCLGCHAHDKAQTDAQHAGTDGYSYDSVSCLACHPGGEGGIPADHDGRYFPTDHGDEENPTHSCAACHGDSGSYTDFDCLSCHAHEKASTDGEHAGLGSGYSYDSPKCLSCHPRGGSVVEDHDNAYFPTGHGGQENPDHACSACHGDSGSYTDFDCLGCHAHEKTTTDNEHAQAGSGYSYDSQSCLKCHPDGTSSMPADHDTKYFPSDHGEQQNPDHSCVKCHGTSGDYAAYDCIGCHSHNKSSTDTTHATAGGGYKYDSPDCLRCHPMGGPVITNHDSYFRTSSGKHSGYTCAECHPTDYKVAACISCHRGSHTCAKMDAKHFGERGYACEDAACLKCHPQGRGD